MTDARPYADKTDAELAAMEQDKTLPIEQWMAVEAERGQRAKEAKAAAKAAARNAPPAAPAAAPTSSAPVVDAGVDSGLADLTGLLVPGERLLAHAVQRRLFALTHRRIIIGATTGRFIALTRGLIGGYTPYDVRWQDLRDVGIRAGIFGADLTITAMESDDLASHKHAGGTRRVFMGLRKEQAQEVYKIAQAQEQSWREKRRIRDLDELRAESGGLQMTGMQMGGAQPSASAGIAPTERLRRAKEMLDSGLITDAEYEAIKARVVDNL
jgi:hypothetical protein